MNSVTNHDTYAKVLITPETASEWLNNCNHKNRKISKELVNRISRAIRNGQWVYNGQPIIFDVDGRLIDGQHRLSAIAKSGCPVESLVVCDINDPLAFVGVDDGKKRTLSDNLSAIGIGHADAVASIGNVFYRIYHCRDLSQFKNSSHAVHHLEMMQFIKQTPHISEAATMALKNRRFCPVGIMGAALTAFMLINETMGKEFHDMFTEDEYAYRNHPIKKLKDRLINDALVSKGKLTRLEKLALIFKAWNNWHSGKVVKELRWRASEGFPVPKGWS